MSTCGDGTSRLQTQEPTTAGRKPRRQSAGHRPRPAQPVARTPGALRRRRRRWQEERAGVSVAIHPTHGLSFSKTEISASAEQTTLQCYPQECSQPAKIFAAKRHKRRKKSKLYLCAFCASSRLSSFGCGFAALRFGVVSNLTYTLQFLDKLGGGAWARLVDVPARRTNHVETITHTNSTGLAFYRVVTPRQP